MVASLLRTKDFEVSISYGRLVSKSAVPIAVLGLLAAFELHRALSLSQSILEHGSSGLVPRRVSGNCYNHLL